LQIVELFTDEDAFFDAFPHLMASLNNACPKCLLPWHKYFFEKKKTIINKNLKTAKIWFLTENVFNPIPSHSSSSWEWIINSYNNEM
jgi:hypothetical protein